MKSTRTDRVDTHTSGSSKSYMSIPLTKSSKFKWSWYSSSCPYVFKWWSWSYNWRSEDVEVDLTSARSGRDHRRVRDESLETWSCRYSYLRSPQLWQWSKRSTVRYDVVDTHVCQVFHIGNSDPDVLVSVVSNERIVFHLLHEDSINNNDETTREKEDVGLNFWRSQFLTPGVFMYVRTRSSEAKERPFFLLWDSMFPSFSFQTLQAGHVNLF